MRGLRQRIPPRLGLLAASLLLSLGWSLTLALPHLRGEASPFERIEAALTDLRFTLAGPRPVPEGVVVVAIDEATIAAAGGYPLPRAYLARLLRALAGAAPAAIAVDILFLDPGRPEADRDLADALRAAPAVVGMAASFPRSGPEVRASRGGIHGIPVAETILRPIAPVREAARLGLVNVASDESGTPRHVPLLVAEGGTLHPALALRAVALATASSPVLTPDTVTIGPHATPIDMGAGLALRFYGPQGTLRTISARSVAEGAAAEGLSGRIVFIGSTALASGDTLNTPFDPVLPGVELLATAASHLLHGDALIRDATVRRADAAAMVGLPLLVLLALSIRRTGLGLALAGLAVGAYCILASALFAGGIWLALALPLAAVAVPLAPFLGARLWLDRRRERELTAARDGLLRFHPPAVAERLAKEPDFLARPVEQAACVLFVDLSGFTGIAERLGPRRTRDLLKEMHDLVEDVATPRGGSVTSFMGDGAMILFGLAGARPDDAARTAGTAFALLADLDGWLVRLGAETGAATGLRIGAHAGPVVLSRLGGAHSQHITATGDTVNVASRLMDVAKEEGVALVLGADLAAGLDLPERGRPERVILRGRAEPVDVLCLRPVPARPVLPSGLV